MSKEMNECLSLSLMFLNQSMTDMEFLSLIHINNIFNLAVDVIQYDPMVHP